MVRPPTSEVELKALDGLRIETIVIYSRESALANSTLFHCDHISHMYEQNQQRLVRIQRAFEIKQQQQQQEHRQQEQHGRQPVNVVRPQQHHQQ